jgi:glycosyltransferase involved in cell wall biosynthesis
VTTAPYVIVTACKNEAAYIGDLIGTVARQTLRPVKWVIVDDNSSDQTCELAQSAGREYDFIEVRRAGSNRPRSFSSQVFAQQEGYEALRNLAFDFVAFLDADIRLPFDYYEKVLSCFSHNESLAVAGGLVVDKMGDTECRSRSKSVNHHVPGGVQCFRRRCYEEIGGYTPIAGGGQDTVAEIMCMMRGGQVRSFLDIVAYHLRPTQSNAHNLFQEGMRWGQMRYNLGYHPLYYGLTTTMRFIKRPSIKLAAGQFYAFLRATVLAKQRSVSPEFVKFIRQLQLHNLRSAILFDQQK